MLAKDKRFMRRQVAADVLSYILSALILNSSSNDDWQLEARPPGWAQHDAA
jgi:hypothetical protein